MILSFFVYGLSALLLYLLGKRLATRECHALRKTGHTLPFFSWEIIASILLFSFICGARYNTGIDYPTYLSEYLHLQLLEHSLRHDFEEGFQAISLFMAQCGFHYFFYFALWGLLQILFIYYALKENKYLIPYVGAAIMAGPYFLEWSNGIRQAIVACFFVSIVGLIRNHKPLLFTACIFIAAFIHKSAYMLLPFYFIYLLSPLLNNNKVNLGILAACILLGSSPTWTDILSSFEDFAALIGFDLSEERIQYMNEELQRETQWGFARISIVTVRVMIIYYYPQLKKFYPDDKKLPIYFSLFFIGVCTYELFVNTNHIWLRPTWYFTIFTLIMGGYALNYLWRTKKHFGFGLFSVLFYSYAFYTVAKIILYEHNYNSRNLYHFFFFET